MRKLVLQLVGTINLGSQRVAERVEKFVINTMEGGVISVSIASLITNVQFVGSLGMEHTIVDVFQGQSTIKIRGMENQVGRSRSEMTLEERV